MCKDKPGSLGHTLATLKDRIAELEAENEQLHIQLDEVHYDAR